MNDAVLILGAGALGAALGLMYFYGLWLTVRLLATRRSPALWLLASWLLRLALLLAGLLWLGSGDWRRLVAALVGILLARVVLTRRLRALQTATMGATPGSEP